MCLASPFFLRVVILSDSTSYCKRISFCSPVTLRVIPHRSNTV